MDLIHIGPIGSDNFIGLLYYDIMNDFTSE